MNNRCLAFLACCTMLSGTAQSTEPEATSAVISDAVIEKALTRPKTRGIRLRETSEAGESKGIDLNIPFELDSSELGPQAVVQLRQLETALKSSALAHDRFFVAGHTDAKGDAEYNRQLSLRRAAAVKDFLVGGGIEPERLQSSGEGESRLLTPDRPEDPINRRVEIRNLGRSEPAVPAGEPGGK